MGEKGRLQTSQLQKVVGFTEPVSRTCYQSISNTMCKQVENAKCQQTSNKNLQCSLLVIHIV
jgi:hypothetical protein